MEPNCYDTYASGDDYEIDILDDQGLIQVFSELGALYVWCCVEYRGSRMCRAAQAPQIIRVNCWSMGCGRANYHNDPDHHASILYACFTYSMYASTIYLYILESRDSSSELVTVDECLSQRHSCPPYRVCVLHRDPVQRTRFVAQPETRRQNRSHENAIVSLLPPE